MEQDKPEETPQGIQKQPTEPAHERRARTSEFRERKSGDDGKSKEPGKFGRRLQRQVLGLVIEFVGLIGFLLILWVGDWVVHALWGPVLLLEHGTGEGIPVKWIFDIGDIALVFCFTARSCTRIFGIIEMDE